MPKRGNKEFLKDIYMAIKRIEEYIEGMDYAKFLQTNLTQDAVVRNLEIIGEAVKNLTPSLVKKHRNIDWKKIAGMRNKIIHYYFGVNFDIVWDVINNKLPELKNKLCKILKEI